MGSEAFREKKKPPAPGEFAQQAPGLEAPSLEKLTRVTAPEAALARVHDANAAQGRFARDAVSPAVASVALPQPASASASRDNASQLAPVAAQADALLPDARVQEAMWASAQASIASDISTISRLLRRGAFATAEQAQARLLLSTLEAVQENVSARRQGALEAASFYHSLLPGFGAGAEKMHAVCAAASQAVQSHEWVSEDAHRDALLALDSAFKAKRDAERAFFSFALNPSQRHAAAFEKAFEAAKRFDGGMSHVRLFLASDHQASALTAKIAGTEESLRSEIASLERLRGYLKSYAKSAHIFPREGFSAEELQSKTASVDAIIGEYKKRLRQFEALAADLKADPRNAGKFFNADGEFNASSPEGRHFAETLYLASSAGFQESKKKVYGLCWRELLDSRAGFQFSVPGQIEIVDAAMAMQQEQIAEYRKSGGPRVAETRVVEKDGKNVLEPILDENSQPVTRSLLPQKGLEKFVEHKRDVHARLEQLRQALVKIQSGSRQIDSKRINELAAATDAFDGALYADNAARSKMSSIISTAMQNYEIAEKGKTQTKGQYFRDWAKRNAWLIADGAVIGVGIAVEVGSFGTATPLVVTGEGAYWAGRAATTLAEEYFQAGELTLGGVLSAAAMAAPGVGKVLVKELKLAGKAGAAENVTLATGFVGIGMMAVGAIDLTKQIASGVQYGVWDTQAIGSGAVFTGVGALGFAGGAKKVVKVFRKLPTEFFTRVNEGSSKPPLVEVKAPPKISVPVRQETPAATRSPASLEGVQLPSSSYHSARVQPAEGVLELMAERRGVKMNAEKTASQTYSDYSELYRTMGIELVDAKTEPRPGRHQSGKNVPISQDGSLADMVFMGNLEGSLARFGPEFEGARITRIAYHQGATGAYELNVVTPKGERAAFFVKDMASEQTALQSEAYKANGIPSSDTQLLRYVGNLGDDRVVSVSRSLREVPDAVKLVPVAETKEHPDVHAAVHANPEAYFFELGRMVGDLWLLGGHDWHGNNVFHVVKPNGEVGFGLIDAPLFHYPADTSSSGGLLFSPAHFQAGWLTSLVKSAGYDPREFVLNPPPAFAEGLTASFNEFSSQAGRARVREQMQAFDGKQVGIAFNNVEAQSGKQVHPSTPLPVNGERQPINASGLWKFDAKQAYDVFTAMLAEYTPEQYLREVMGTIEWRVGVTEQEIAAARAAREALAAASTPVIRESVQAARQTLAEARAQREASRAARDEVRIPRVEPVVREATTGMPIKLFEASANQARRPVERLAPVPTRAVEPAARVERGVGRAAGKEVGVPERVGVGRAREDAGGVRVVEPSSRVQAQAARAEEPASRVQVQAERAVVVARERFEQAAREMESFPQGSVLSALSEQQRVLLSERLSVMSEAEFQRFMRGVRAMREGAGARVEAPSGAFERRVGGTQLRVPGSEGLRQAKEQITDIVREQHEAAKVFAEVAGSTPEDVLVASNASMVVGSVAVDMRGAGLFNELGRRGSRGAGDEAFAEYLQATVIDVPDRVNTRLQGEGLSGWVRAANVNKSGDEVEWVVFAKDKATAERVMRIIDEEINAFEATPRAIASVNVDGYVAAATGGRKVHAGGSFKEVSAVELAAMARDARKSTAFFESLLKDADRKSEEAPPQGRRLNYGELEPLYTVTPGLRLSKEIPAPGEVAASKDSYRVPEQTRDQYIKSAAAGGEVIIVEATIHVEDAGTRELLYATSRKNGKAYAPAASGEVDLPLANLVSHSAGDEFVHATKTTMSLAEKRLKARLLSEGVDSAAVDAVRVVQPGNSPTFEVYVPSSLKGRISPAEIADFYRAASKEVFGDNFSASTKATAVSGEGEFGAFKHAVAGATNELRFGVPSDQLVLQRKAGDLIALALTKGVEDPFMHEVIDSALRTATRGANGFKEFQAWLRTGYDGVRVPLRNWEDVSTAVKTRYGEKAADAFKKYFTKQLLEEIDDTYYVEVKR